MFELNVKKKKTEIISLCHLDNQGSQQHPEVNCFKPVQDAITGQSGIYIKMVKFN